MHKLVLVVHCFLKTFPPTIIAATTKSFYWNTEEKTFLYPGIYAQPASHLVKSGKDMKCT